MNNFFRSLFSFCFNLCLNNRLMLATLGRVNRRWNFLVTFYIGYSAHKSYTHAYTCGNNRLRNWLEKNYKWKPFLAGISFQNGKLGLISFISASEEDLANRDNLKYLRTLETSSDNIRRLTGAQQKTYAGTLPGILFRKRITTEVTGTEVVVTAVKKAIEYTLEIEKLEKDTPVIILGGRGFIGRRVVKSLTDKKVYPVDNPNEKEISKHWPSHLYGQPALLVNISRVNVINNYLPLIWKDLILLNEVYPEPDQTQVNSYLLHGKAIYHLAGVRGQSLPGFPQAYSNCVPCSAAFPHENLTPVVKCLGKN